MKLISFMVHYRFSMGEIECEGLILSLLTGEQSFNIGGTPK